jgi:hypothetical protein
MNREVSKCTECGTRVGKRHSTVCPISTESDCIDVWVEPEHCIPLDTIPCSRSVEDIKEAGTSDGSSADYYKLPRDSSQLQDLISHKDMNAQIGEIFRACYRYGEVSHSDKMRDAKKMRFYAEAEVVRLERSIAKVH